MKGKVHSAKVPDQEGLRLLLECARMETSSIKHLWLDADYQDKGKKWAEVVLGLSAEVVSKSLKPVSKKVRRLWGVAEEVGSREDLFMVGTE